MTDKQIDKVGVSKCKYNNNGWCLLSESCDQIKYKSCYDMTLFDCYYRQLKTKEQECEASHGYILRLEEELEIEEAEALRAEVIMLEKTEETDKYKQALTEIKEIITKSCIDIDDDDYIHLSHMKQILQKCEVIDED
jgi:hypothetical protein